MHDLVNAWVTPSRGGGGEKEGMSGHGREAIRTVSGVVSREVDCIPLDVYVNPNKV